MFKRLQTWLHEIEFAEDENARLANILYIILLPTLVGAGLSIITYTGFHAFDTVLGLFGFVGLIAIVYALLRRGWTKAAAMALIVSLIILATVMLYQADGGIRDEAVFIYPATMIIAGIILTGPWFVLSILLTILSAGFIIYGEFQGFIAVNGPPPIYPAYLVTISLILSIIAIGLNMLTRGFFNSLNRTIRAERALSEVNRELDHRVRDRTAELVAANQELQDLIYTLAHDLRAPARSMIGFSRLLQQEYAMRLDEDGQHYLNRINLGAQSMGQMIDELLTFNHLRQQTLRKRSVDMHALVLQVLEEFEPERTRRQVEIWLGSLPDAEADPEMLEDVWRQMLANAFNFTQNTPLPEIAIGFEQKNDILYYFVRDNGVGFDMQYADKLFGVFHRLHLEEEYDGTGMGLAIAKRIVTRHGGKIWAEAEVNKGATFYFRLSVS